MDQNSSILERDTMFPAEDSKEVVESPQQISAAYSPYERLKPEAEDDKDGEYSDDDFEFAYVSTDSDTGLSADDIFSDGQILPVYPVFNRDLLSGGRGSAAAEEKEATISLRRLLIEDRSSEPRSDPDGLESVPEETYCVWAPRRSPEWSSRSSSAGSSSSSRRWHLRDLVRHRSHSDGKEKFVLLESASAPLVKENKSAGPKPNPKFSPAAAVAAEVKEGEKSGKSPKVRRATEMDMVTAHRLYYGKSSGEQALKGVRRTYLPYRQELLVGIFPHRHGNGLGRSHHPST